MIVSEIEALLDWQGDVIRLCLFPGSQTQPADLHAPSGLIEWCRREQEKNILDSKFVDRITGVHEALVALRNASLRIVPRAHR